MTLSDLQLKNKNLIERFQKIEPKEWGVEGSALELSAETGDLIDLLMRDLGYKRKVKNTFILENEKSLKKETIMTDEEIFNGIEDEITDILFVLFRIADIYNINIEGAYLKMMERATQKLDNLGV